MSTLIEFFVISQKYFTNSYIKPLDENLTVSMHPRGSVTERAVINALNTTNNFNNHYYTNTHPLTPIVYIKRDITCMHAPVAEHVHTHAGPLQ